MAHFAELDENNIVKRVIVIDNKDVMDASEQEREEIGIAYCQRHFGGRWVQTSYNSSIRKNYARNNYKYDEERDAFIPPQPFPSWTLNEQTCGWEPPEPEPIGPAKIIDGVVWAHRWDESQKKWIEYPLKPEF